VIALRRADPDSDDYAYYKAEDYEAKMEALGRPETCDCGGEYHLTTTSTYGDDADARRGVPLRVWTCTSCEAEAETIGA